MEAEGAGKTGWPGAQVGTKETQSGRALPDAVAGQVPPFWLRRYPARVAPEDMGGQGGLAIWAEQGDDWTFCQCA